MMAAREGADPAHDGADRARDGGLRGRRPAPPSGGGRELERLPEVAPAAVEGLEEPQDLELQALRVLEVVGQALSLPGGRGRGCLRGVCWQVA